MPSRIPTLALAFLAATGAAGQEAPRPRLALALSGGGARGIAHIGALRALEEAGRQDRYGSTVGVSFDWKEVRLPGGLLADHRVNRFLIENLSPASYAAGSDFDRLAIPFRATRSPWSRPR